jgi:hypothetical protein
VTSPPADRQYLGWQYATPYPDPGPAPRRPAPPEHERLDPAWAAAQRRQENLLNRPLKVTLGTAVAVGLVAIVLGTAGWLPVLAAGLGVIICLLIAALCGQAVWQGERALRSRLADEQSRLGRLRAAQQDQLFTWQAEHARQVRDWQAQRVAYEHQKRWYGVTVPGRVDLAGGTLSGWSALLTTVAAHRLAAGAEVTVLDLTEGSVALDLVAFARTSGIEPLVWVLPEDLSRLGTGPVPLPPGALRVVAVGQHADPALATHLAVALVNGMRRDRPGQHMVFVLGADRLRGDTLDRLSDACEACGTGLVLGYRCLAPHVRQRLGRGNAAVAFMRLGSAEDAQAASEHLGTEHRFVLPGLTDTIGRSVADTTAARYTSTAGSVTPPAASGPGSQDTGSQDTGSQDTADRDTGSRDTVDSAVSTSTAWGVATVQAAGDGQSLAAARQPSREFRAGQRELQQLPASVMIVTYAGPGGRQVVLADANPGLGALGAATRLTLEEYRSLPAAAAAPRARPAPESGRPGPDAPARWRSGRDRPPPNLGPPPSRLDWRRRRS